jgi:transposase
MHVNALPDDVATLKALIAKKDERIAQLEHNVHILTKWMFEKKSERRPVDPQVATNLQSSLLFPEIIEAAERVADQTGASGTIEVKKPPRVDPRPPRKKRGRRSEFPDHLPVIKTTFDVAENERACERCHVPLQKIGEEVTKELERIEMTIVHEIARSKYACKKCQMGVKIASGPDRVIDRGLLGVGFLAHLLNERFGNHMPYNRLEQKHQDEWLSLSRSVLCTSAGRVAELMKPIYAQVRKDTLASGYVQTDGTGALMLDPPNKTAANPPTIRSSWTARSSNSHVGHTRDVGSSTRKRPSRSSREKRSI